MNDILVARGEHLTIPMNISLLLTVCLYLAVVGRKIKTQCKRERENINIQADCVNRPRVHWMSLAPL